ncbi:Protein Y73C8B.3 [Aphelenchoides avenae]|nr:Protein Y73C8B.3 [Aphelenchus avenae]
MNLFQVAVPVQTPSKEVELNAVYLDTHPEGSSRGTVIFTNGAPGSHKDFKYVTPLLAEDGIRVVGVNFPGMGYTPYDHRLRDTSAERVQFLQGILEALDLRENLVFVGHSRGSDDVLRMSVLHKEGTHGVVLINPIGLRSHHILHPWWLLRYFNWQWKVSVTLQYALNPFYAWLYSLFKVPVDSGHQAGMCLNLMGNTDYPGQKKFIDELLESGLKILVACAHKDKLIESPISREFLEAFKGIKRMTCSTKGEDKDLTSTVTKELHEGTSQIGIYFTEDGHHLQKQRPEFFAKAITTIFDECRKKE